MSEVEKCYKYRPEGIPFKFILNRVIWSGDAVESCSICKMSVYDPDWGEFHKINKEDE